LASALTGAIIGLSRWSSGTVLKHPLLHSVLFVVLLWAARSTLEDNFVLFLLCVLLIGLFRMERGMATNGRSDSSPDGLRRVPV